MTTPQHKLGSAFGPRSTANEVLEGIDLSGRLALVTGGYSGLGLEATRSLASAGAHAAVAGQKPGSEHANRVEIRQVELVDLDASTS